MFLSLSEVLSVLKNIRVEMEIIRMKIEAIENILGEEMSEEDRRALIEALEEYRRGETVSLEEVEKEVEAKSRTLKEC